MDMFHVKQTLGLMFKVSRETLQSIINCSLSK